MGRPRKNAEQTATEPKKTEKKVVKAETKQVETKQNKPKITFIAKPGAFTKLTELVQLHPTATANVLRAITTDEDVKELLDKQIAEGKGNEPVDVGL